jgi:hypothetical protein
MKQVVRLERMNFAGFTQEFHKNQFNFIGKNARTKKYLVLFLTVKEDTDGFKKKEDTDTLPTNHVQ